MLAQSQIEATLGDRTRVVAALGAVNDEARLTVDSRHLEICEGRVGELLGAPGPRIQATSDFERALVAFVEQWVIDVASITDELVAPLHEALGDDGLQDFVHGLLVVEQRLRLRLAWEQLGLIA